MARIQYNYGLSGIDGGEVTVREVLFCGLIVGLMSIAGFFISGAIKRHVQDSNLKYRQAVHIVDDGEFEQAFNTGIGNAFVYGRFSCEGVPSDVLVGRYLSVSTEHQEYRKHTRTETYSVSVGKGRTQTRTRTVTYWTWDTMSKDEVHCDTVCFKGKWFGYGTFDYSRVPSDTSVVSTGFNRRDVVKTLPMSFNCSVFCNMGRKSFCGTAEIFYKMENDAALEMVTSSVADVLFWIAWTMLSIVVSVWFCKNENKWLNG